MLQTGITHPNALSKAFVETSSVNKQISSITFAYNMLKEALDDCPKPEPWIVPNFSKFREDINYLEATIELQDIFISNPYNLPRDVQITVQNNSYRKEHDTIKEDVVKLKAQYYQAVMKAVIELNTRLQTAINEYSDKKISWAEFVSRLQSLRNIGRPIFNETNTIPFTSIHSTKPESKKNDANQAHTRQLLGTWFKIQTLTHNPWGWRCPQTFASLLHIAALNDDISFAKALVRLGLSTWSLDKHRNRPNDIAKGLGHFDFIKEINLYAAINNPQMIALQQSAKPRNTRTAHKLF